MCTVSSHYPLRFSAEFRSSWPEVSTALYTTDPPVIYTLQPFLHSTTSFALHFSFFSLYTPSSHLSAMAQIRGTAGYNLGHQNPFGGPGSADATSDPSPLDAIREQTSKIEDWLDTMSDPVKPYVITPVL